MFEWCNSPIIYKASSEFDEVRKLLSDCFSVKKGLFHYWHMAENNYRPHLDGDIVKLKKYFYVLRPVLAAKWIMEKKSPPPVLFDDLVRKELPDELKPEVQKLVEQKRQVSELGTAEKIQVIDEYLKQSIDHIKRLADDCREEGKSSWDVLDQCFIKILEQTWK